MQVRNWVFNEIRKKSKRFAFIRYSHKEILMNLYTEIICNQIQFYERFPTWLKKISLRKKKISCYLEW